MHGLSLQKQMLVRRLEKIGIENSSIPGFIWSLKSCFFVDPVMSRSKINERLESLGWQDFKLDRRTFGMLIACFKAETENFETAES